MKLFFAIKKINKIVFAAGLFLLAVSYFQKEKFPDKNLILDKLYIAPVQTETKEKPFEIEKKGITYKIVPVYNYELSGLVVSYNNSDNWYDYYHEQWKDYINVKDICVVWGENIKTDAYKSFDFTSGSWTCYADSKPGISQEQWSSFKGNNLSNNHLLADNEEINKKIMDADIGDQIHLKGYLSEYSVKNGTFKRGTSTTRDDNGNGACETIYVTDFEIVKKGNEIWHYAYDASKYAIVISFILMIIIFLKEPVSSNED
jgi:hypothetical protein